MPSKTITLDSTTKRVAAFAAGILVLIFTFFALRWTLGNAASTRADVAEIAQLTTQLAPDDPQTHYAAAVLLEKQFDVASLDVAVKEYEKAAALSPSNYLYWLALGSARERAGERIGGERALRKALELAPNYSRVHWALGNALVRQGRTDEGFAEIRKAVSKDPALIRQSIMLAMQLFDGDITQVRKAIGDSRELTAALPVALAEGRRYDEAFQSYELLEPDEKKQAHIEYAEKFLPLFVDAKKFRYALTFTQGGDNIQQDQITNGGFENAIRIQSANIFDWQIAPGQHPQITPTSGQKHSGNVSLVLIFNSTKSEDFRTVSQTIAVEPGREYELEAFYRSDLKTKVGFKWEVVDAVNNSVLASTEATAPSADWTRVSARFRVPADVDGIIIRLGRVNCDGPVCQVAGNLWFDDTGLKRID